jgi:hypothetical protein
VQHATPKNQQPKKPVENLNGTVKNGTHTQSQNFAEPHAKMVTSAKENATLEDAGNTHNNANSRNATPSRPTYTRLMTS